MVCYAGKIKMKILLLLCLILFAHTLRRCWCSMLSLYNHKPLHQQRDRLHIRQILGHLWEVIKRVIVKKAIENAAVSVKASVEFLQFNYEYCIFNC
jgi:hypothetical protein